MIAASPQAWSLPYAKRMVHHSGAAYSTGTFSNPPTDAELDSEFGTPGTVGGGFLAALNNGGNHYFVWASGDSWLYITGTVAV